MLSVVIPVYNEKENILPLLEELHAAALRVPIMEIIYADDGSDDGTREYLQQLTHQYPLLRTVHHEGRGGQSHALWTGIFAARQPVIVTLDGDGQNDPADIGLLYDRYRMVSREKPRVMIAGQRSKRNDNWLRRFSSRGANKIRSSILKDGTRDTGCSLKLFRREDYLGLPYFNHMHRYLPALMKAHHVDVHHVDVSHRPRERGVSKYGFWNRAWVGLHDLIGVSWLLRRRRPNINVSEYPRPGEQNGRHAAL